MFYVQINLRLRHKWLLNKTLNLGTIVWDNVGSSLEWVVETQLATYENEDQYWIDLDLVPRVEDVNIVLHLQSQGNQVTGPILMPNHVEVVEDEGNLQMIL